MMIIIIYIFVGEGEIGIVKKIDFDGPYLLQLDSQRAGLHNPRGITVHINRAYVANYNSHCIFVFKLMVSFVILLVKDR